jgi:hypothetical protein
VLLVLLKSKPKFELFELFEFVEFVGVVVVVVVFVEMFGAWFKKLKECLKFWNRIK